MVGGRLRDVVVHEGSTVLSDPWTILAQQKTKNLFTGMCACLLIDHALLSYLCDGCLKPASRKAS